MPREETVKAATHGTPASHDEPIPNHDHGHGDRWGAVRRRLTAIVVSVLCSVGFGLVLWAPAAGATRGHVFSMTFGSEGSGAGELKEPMGVAVNEATSGATAGDVYVADFGNNRVQWFAFNPVANEYEVAGQITAATGITGCTLTEESTKIESCAPVSGTLVVGQTITGEGIPAETKITAIEPSGTIEISNPVEPGKSGLLIELTATQALVQPRAVAVDNSPSSPSASDTYVSAGPVAEQVIDKFTPTGEFIGQITHTPEATSFFLVQGLAVDPAGTLWALETHETGTTIDHFNNSTPNEYEQACQAPGTSQFGLAVDANDNLYIETNAAYASGEGGVAEFDSKCKLLNNALDTGASASAAEAGVTFYGVAVEFSSGDVYVDNVETIGRFAAKDGSEIERFGAGNLAATGCNGFVKATCLGGLAVNGAAGGATAGDVYAAVGTGAHIVVFALEEPAAPLVNGESVVKVTDNSATLQAEINPRSLPAEAATEYHFEYGPCPGTPYTCTGSGYPSKTTVGTLPPAFEVDRVSAPVEGLHAGTTYHFRIVATNELGGPVLGPERTFTASSGGEFALADGRKWEMVSPQAMQGALIQPLGQGSGSNGATTQAAAAGGALAYATNAPIEPEPAGNAASPQVLSTRGAGGWSSRDITVPHAVATGVQSLAVEVRLFSADLSLAAVQPLGSFVPLSEAASEQTAYLRDNHAGSYTPLVTGCPEAPTPCPQAVQEHADVLPGTVFGNRSLEPEGSCPPRRANCGANFVGGTPDLKHVILTAATPLKPGANAQALYEWNAGTPASEQLQLVSLLPPVEPSTEELPAPGPHLGAFSFNVAPDQRGAVSVDGSRVFFSSESHLYMRDMVAGKTVQVDVPEQGCVACGGGFVAAAFQFASADGSRVFFTDTQKLTAGAGEYGVNGRGADLYVCEVHEDACALTDLARSGAVLGEVIGASEDGSWVYFAANGALVPGAVSGACPNGAASETASPAVSCDLYVEHYAAGVWGPPRVVAVVSGADQLDWGQVLEGMVARVSPGGGWLAFMSQRSLTGYDNRDAVSGRPAQEVFLYDAVRGRLTCASCNPSGARPTGVEYGNGSSVPLLGNPTWPSQTLLAGSVPAWVIYKGKQALYQPRYLSDSGRLFFDSHDALVPKDVNGTGDVYEYEPAGVPAGEHACSAASASGGIAYKPGRSFKVEVEGKPVEVEGEPVVGEEGAGCVGLMSSGSSGEESAFLDASESGGDVFFISTARLSPLDSEGGLTAYDAHECTGGSPCFVPLSVSPPACDTEASCKAAPSPQPSIFGLSGSATFSGPGNPPPPAGVVKTAAQVRAEKLAKALKACHKIKQRAKRQRCERQARKSYGARAAGRAGRASNNGGAGR